MSARGKLIVLDLDPDRMTALYGSVTGSGVVVSTWCSFPRPSAIDARDARAIGSWVGEELTRSGMTSGKLVLVVPRGDVILKRMAIPRGPGLGEEELAGAVKLQMHRQLTVAMDGTAIDYMPADKPGAPEAPEASVMAAALPGERFTWLREVARASGREVARIGLRSSGSAALLAAASQKRSGSILGIAVGWASTEFVVVADGGLVFARAVDMPLPGSSEDQAFAERVALEAKRTWMSYRASREAAEVEAVVVLGASELDRLVGRQSGSALEMPWEQVDYPSLVTMPDVPEPERTVIAPLVGLLAERVIGRASFDFAHPRRAKDRAAARRQRVLLAVLGMILGGGGLYAWSLSRLDALESTVEKAAERVADLDAERARIMLERARLEHLRAASEAKVDWLAHLAWLASQVPEPPAVLMEGIGGTARTGVTFQSKEGSIIDSTWEPTVQASIRVDGRVRDRAVANALRERLVSSAVYGLESRGADLADRFSFILKSSRRRPEDEPATTPVAKEPG